jgi:D-arabinonate dehydratase
MLRITDVRAVTCDVPVPRPIVMGDLRYDTRDYAIVEIETDAGVCGIGFGMARYAPVADVIERNLKPLLVGEDALLTERLWDRLYYLNLPIAQRGIFMRALSLVDIALWDIKGKAAGLPVWKLFGGHRDRMPVLVAGGYVAADKSTNDLSAEIRDYVRRGFAEVKIAAGQVLERDTERVAAAREAAGAESRLIYDAHWQWREPQAVLRVIKDWERFDLGWIEDPFPSEMLDPLERLRERTGIPLAMGEDLTGRWAFRNVLERKLVDVLRVDVTNVGGFTEALKVCALAAAYDVPVSPHVFPELHVHLAAGLANVQHVEITDPPQGIEALHVLLTDKVEIKDGHATAPDRPGLGCGLERDAMERYRRR